MKRAIVTLAATAMVVGLFASAASAKNVVHHNVRPAAACSLGSCFVPHFPSVGSAASYAGPAAGLVLFADCCVAGDTYKVTTKGPLSKSAITFTSSGTLDANCPETTTPPDYTYLVTASGTTKIKIKAISLPGGAPADAYVQTNAAGWGQAGGQAACVGG